MNHFPKESNYLVLVLCLLLSTAFISKSAYSHSIPTPVDIKSNDGTPVELVTHIDLYDDDGNFMTHLHEWSISRYTQEEVDEIHANNPHTSTAVIESLPEEGDVKGVSQKTYNTPYFPAPDDASEIGKPDPEGKYDDYGVVSNTVVGNEETSTEDSEGEDSQDGEEGIALLQSTEVVFAEDTFEYARATAVYLEDNTDKSEVNQEPIEGGGSQGIQPPVDDSSQNAQPTQAGSQGIQPPVDDSSQNAQPTQAGSQGIQPPVDDSSQNAQPTQAGSQGIQPPVDDSSQNAQPTQAGSQGIQPPIDDSSQNAQPTQAGSQGIQPPIDDSSQNAQPTTSVPTVENGVYGYVENSITASRELEIVGIVEKEQPRRLVVTIRNNGQNFVDLTEGWSLTLVRTDGSSVSVNMKSRNSLFITPYNNNDGVYADTDISLLPKNSFVELDTQEHLFLDFPYFYGQQSGYSQDDVLILSYEGAEMSRYPEAVGNAPRLRTSLITTWGSMKKAE